MQLSCYSCKMSSPIPEGEMWGAEREFSRGEVQYKLTCPNCKASNLVYKIPYEFAKKSNVGVVGVEVPGEKAVKKEEKAASEPKLTKREETKKNKEERKAKRAEKGH